MFSISFGEILLIATVGLVVIGPKRLPQAARFAGHLAGRLQRQIQSVKADINREMAAADLKSIQREYKDAASSAQDIYNSAAGGVKEAAREVSSFPPPHTAPAGDGDGHGDGNTVATAHKPAQE